MTREELNRVLDLQNKAYKLLLWIDGEAPQLLSDTNVEAWKQTDTCEDWARQMMNTFPFELQCEENDIPTFSHLFSAFFTTSFHVEQKNESNWARTQGHHYDVWSRRKLVAGTTSIKKTKGQKEKQAKSAHNLRLIALEELAIENDVDLSHQQLETLANDSAIADALNLYSYAHELVRRSQFASQGAAVHSLWSTMDKKTRQSLNAEVIWQARETLLAAIRTAAK